MLVHCLGRYRTAVTNEQLAKAQPKLDWQTIADLWYLEHFRTGVSLFESLQCSWRLAEKGAFPSV